MRDFRLRIAHYERAYEEVGEDEGPFVRIIDVGRKMVLHRIQGYLLARVVHFLLNLHVQPRSVWLTRHGESAFNVLGRIGGDAALSDAGRGYAAQLANVIRDRAAGRRRRLDEHPAAHHRDGRDHRAALPRVARRSTRSTRASATG